MTSARYREYAAKCVALAQRQEDAQEKLALNPPRERKRRTSQSATRPKSARPRELTAQALLAPSRASGP